MRLAGVFVFATLAASAQTVAPPPDTAQLQATVARQQKVLQDWANLQRYAAEDASTPAPAAGQNRVVFMGDSITDFWGRQRGEFFPGKPYINRGISGQTTPQMLIRFRPDVINLRAKVVVILAGTNDIAGNTGPETLEDIEGNLLSMVQLAQANHIAVVLASLTPVSDDYTNQTRRRPPDQIKALNAWIQSECQKDGLTFLDYYSATVDDRGQFKKDLTYDGLHPTAAGYAVMGPLAQQAIDKALSSAQ